MYSKGVKKTDGIFSASSNRGYTVVKKYTNPILASCAFFPGEGVEQKIKAIKDKEAVLTKEIVNVRAKLENLQNQSYDLYKQRESLEEPFVFYERARRDIETMSLEITNAITSALLRGATTIKVGTGYGHVEGLFGFFALLFSTYNINLETETEYGQGEMYVRWKCKIPTTYSQPTLIALEDNPKFNEMAFTFDKQLALSYKRVEDKIVEDLSKLDEDLIQPILQGHSKAFTLLKPCPVAYERFLEIAENNNICLTIQKNVIVAANKSISHSVKF